MTQFLTKDQVKLNLRIDHDDEDRLIEDLIAVAFETFEQTTNRKLYAQDVKIPDDVKNGIHISPSIIQGAHMLIGHLYANRESVALGAIAVNIPQSTDWFWKRHRWVNL